MIGICWARTDKDPTTPNLTKGKWYMNTKWDEEGSVMWIANDVGSECLIILEGFGAQCAYLQSGDVWEVVRELPKD
jgi:hypothetical protein